MRARFFVFEKSHIDFYLISQLMITMKIIMYIET